MTWPRSVVVVGASAAGLAAAEGLRRQGYDGSLTLIGEESHAPYDRPPLSKQLLAGSWEADRTALRTPEVLSGLDLELRLGSAATGLDTRAREVVLADGSRVAYEGLVIATGTRARRLPGTDGVPGVHVLRTLEDALALRAQLALAPHLVIVGGGFVGAEAAAVARGLGCEVTLVTDAPQPMSDALGSDIGAVLRQVHTEHGVKVVTGVLAERILIDGGRATGVVLSDGRTVSAGAVLVGIGAVPNTEWLAGSGIPLGNGIECDATLRAGDGVWAAGDVASWPDPLTGARTRVEHRTNAGEQGLAAARNLLAEPGAAVPFSTVPYVWSDQYDLKIQIHGRTGGADRIALVDGSLDARKFTALYGRDGHVCGAVGVNMLRPLRALRPLVADRVPWDEALAAGAVEPPHGEPIPGAIPESAIPEPTGGAR
ncbi:NAD(P)/FAD-dependent oxidoreductase [Streptomyces tsukubensis]|uniref:FAD-dependent oxidoreductase n=1 Tax=Streptomyces tsukubensis TaxID=83656 RepID=A0A1V4AFW7_9ACTN|nr:FAD-dependent oxidoreductase [Streptomyces tsukubensis]OON82782.1 FAD-dependent oxidoreductase [Streptomyces tsukubensis]